MNSKMMSPISGYRENTENSLVRRQGEEEGAQNTPHFSAPPPHALRLSRRSLIGYLWAVGGAGFATGLFWLLRAEIDRGQESLLYLLMVIACAVRFGFGPAVLGAVLSFCCWDFFFVPPYHAFWISNLRDLLSLVVFLIVAITTARLGSHAREQAQEAKDREREMAILYHTSETVSSEVEIDRLLLTLVSQVLCHCHTERCLVLKRWPQSDALTIAAVAAKSPLTPKIEALILKTAETAVETEEARGHYIPLQVQGKSVGVLHVGPHQAFKDRIETAFSAQEERLILTMAHHAAIVIARQHLAEEARQQARQSAILEERNRLAKEVHDTLSHSFTGIKFLLEAAHRVWPTNEALECITQARALAIEGAQEARRSVWALRPAALEATSDLAAAIKYLALQQTAATPIQFQMTVRGDLPPLPASIEENLLRLCQEAMTNILRHAQATQVNIELTVDLHQIRLSVKDNGCGFSPAETKRREGFGLISMRERSQEMAGTLEIWSQPGQGTEITVHVPIAPEDSLTR